MHLHRSQPRLPGRLCGLLGLWLSLVLAGVIVGHAPEAAAKSASSKKSAGKKKVKKKTKGKPAAPRIEPLSREVDGPTGVTSGGDLEDEEGEGDADDGEDTDGGDPMSELEAIEREILAQPIEPGPVLVELPPVVSDPRPIDNTPRWVKHTIIPGESLDDVATRYGVDAKRLARWNNLKGEKPALRSGKQLRVHAVNPPPMRERVEHVVKRGEDWDSLAKAYGVEAESLQAWNRKLGKTLTSKEKVLLWREPPPLAASSAGLAAKLAQIRVPAGGVSIGRPSRGRLVRGVELPDRPELYTRRKPDESWGSSHAITQLMAAIVRFRHDTGFRRSIVIGGISRARGGRFRPHKSHQSGRDIDIRMPLTAAAEGKKHVTANDIDWRATWQLMHAFIAAGETEYIFLDYGLQKRIYKAARESGVSKEQLAAWIQWPLKKPKHQVVRHVTGHKVHFHVRVRCAEQEKHCVTTR
jgi:murein endopeptidase/LysM repeat protein